MDRVRMPIVAGSFYPDDVGELNRAIESCFLDGLRGVGCIPDVEPTGGKGAIGMVCPHAGYLASGAIAAHSFSWLAGKGRPDVIVVLGPNHTGIGPSVSVMNSGIWRMPMGDVRIDEGFASSLCNDIIIDDFTAHKHEHSIEVQLPFLQYIFDGSEFGFVPICMLNQSWESALKVGERIAEVASNRDDRVLIIASSDFSHIGPHYGCSPPRGMTSEDYMRSNDRMLIDRILAFDPEGLCKLIDERHMTMCGPGPIAAMLVALNRLGASSVELLKYGDSYEVWPDSSCVGYGAMAIW